MRSHNSFEISGLADELKAAYQERAGVRDPADVAVELDEHLSGQRDDLLAVRTQLANGIEALNRCDDYLSAARKQPGLGNLQGFAGSRSAKTLGRDAGAAVSAVDRAIREVDRALAEVRRLTPGASIWRHASALSQLAYADKGVNGGLDTTRTKLGMAVDGAESLVLDAAAFRAAQLPPGSGRAGTTAQGRPPHRQGGDTRSSGRER
ncbi:hypothetical protein FB561_3229 [Kribbella amoyensis]|uniref:Uncharacterized protein n=1 Tax=Kribbella amoyensis TaxID=996641 RepID=A0A561BTF9_9ACTN|nr:hypothetical protein [Kribbella amoyensis]TWD82102.1 hypothetical protein FB561_3229 [Kribbella amoyensis]